MTSTTWLTSQVVLTVRKYFRPISVSLKSKPRSQKIYLPIYDTFDFYPNEMADHNLSKRYGVRPVDIKRSFYIGFENKPLTAEQIRQNRIRKRKIQLWENYNNECRALIHTLDDKTFVTDNLAFMTSQLSSEVFHISYCGPEYEEENEDVPLAERRAAFRTRLADARLTLPTDTHTHTIY